MSHAVGAIDCAEAEDHIGESHRVRKHTLRQAGFTDLLADICSTIQGLNYAETAVGNGGTVQNTSCKQSRPAA